ncbi:MAG TPA: hypothetical protein VHE30_03940 [Polyangiaceae bacterium]|nr:hypothetical protein [Polyangiaceae bacterium]
MRPLAWSLIIGLSLGTGCRKDSRRELSEADMKRALAELARRRAERRREEAPPGAAPASSTTESAASGSGDAPLAEPPPAGTRAAAPFASAPGPGAPAPQSPWTLDRPVTLGPGAPVTATSFGVVANDREGNLFVLRLGRLPSGPAPGSTPLPALPDGSGPYSLGRGPGVFQNAAYWISHGSLVRRSLSGKIGPLEILAKDAHDGTRVAVPVPAPGRALAKIPNTVSYIVRPEKEDAPLVAKLWVEGSPPETLTAEGNSTHSVSLVQTEDGVLALSVQARMAMTPVHARRITFPNDRPLLGEDLVVWVGGGIQPLTEMTILPGGGDSLYGFIPHERSIQEFGVAELALGMHPGMDTKTTWLVYPNGIDPAPVAAGHVCGEPVLFYAEPESSRPDSEQELVLRSLSDTTGKRVARLQTGRAYYFTSIAEVPGGALAAWVGEDGTHASTLRCTRRGK